MPDASSSSPPDIVILHGRSQRIVDQFREWFGSLGLTAEVVLSMPSGGLTQEPRVRQAVRTCRLPVVVATFDEDDPKGTKPGPNVLDEIRLCRELRNERGFLVLREVEGVRKVQLASNLDGHLVEIEFDRSSLFRCLVQLNRELIERKLVATSGGSRGLHAEGETLSDFVDQMDDLWDHHLDDTWNAIFNIDVEAERHITNEIDKFFQCYHKVFLSVVKKQKTGGQLKEVCDSSILEAQALTLRCWQYAIEGRRRDILQRLLERTNVRGEKLPASRRDGEALRHQIDGLWNKARARARTMPFNERASALRGLLEEAVRLDDREFWRN